MEGGRHRGLAFCQSLVQYRKTMSHCFLVDANGASSCRSRLAMALTRSITVASTVCVQISCVVRLSSWPRTTCISFGFNSSCPCVEKLRRRTWNVGWNPTLSSSAAPLAATPHFMPENCTVP